MKMCIPRLGGRQKALFLFWIFATLLCLHPAYAGTSPSIKLTAESGQGVNPTTAVLGRNTGFTATVSGTSNTAVTWSLSGGGTLTSAGAYTAPNTMPSSSTVVVTATLTSQTSVSASYTMTLINPVPSITNTTPLALTAGITNSLLLNGYGFIPGTTVLVNGTAVPTTYTSIYHVTAQVPVSASASGPISISASNPTPGGGTSNVDAVPLAAPAITITAISGQGVNPTTAVLGRNTGFSANVTGSANTAVTWSMTGAGTLTSAGAFTAPNTMPASPTFVVTATLVSQPSVTASYTMTLINPVPSITNTTPLSLTAGTTNSLLLNGYGFVPGTTVLVNGTAVPTTYTSIYHVTAQVPVSASASGPISISASNPTPGGGVSNVDAVPLASTAIKITAESGQGVNPSTACLGRNTGFTASVSGTPNTAVTWSLNGAGTLTSAGAYSAPDVMPSNPTVVVTATLVSQPSVTASYTMTLINPTPTINSTFPTSVNALSSPVVINGYGYVAGSTVMVNGKAVPTTFGSIYYLTAQVPATAGQSTPLSITVQNPSPGGGASNVLSLPVDVPGVSGVSPNPIPAGASTITITGNNFTSTSVVTLDGNAMVTTYVSPTKLTAAANIAPWRSDSVAVGVAPSATEATAGIDQIPIQNTATVPYDTAARFASQAAWGPRPDVVAQIQQLGLAGFLTQQFAQPVSTYPVPVPITSDSPQSQFTLNALTGSNLLRQRVAFALEEFITASVNNNSFYMSGVPWQLLMEKDAFGNFRDLMTDVTLNTTMGVWLNLGNNWAPTSSSVHPNQNYARELMQLFTMGPVMLNMDGTPILDSSGNPESSIDTATVLDLSRALTGWGLPPADGSLFSAEGYDYSLPMIAYDSRHDHGQKTLFGTTVLPAGQNITEDLSSALDAIFNHPNVPPFVSRILIQHLVKSNPSPAYVARVAAVFANDGTGVRGNLTAVVRAILLDEEARAGDTGTVGATDGHLQEPIIYFMSVMSGLQMAPTAQNFVLAEQGLGEYLWEPESVFSFYAPSFMIPGTTINAPEFQIFDGNLQLQRSQILYNMLNGTQYDFSGAPYRNTDWFFSYFQTIPSIVDAVNHMFYHGTMPASTQTAIESYCQSLPTLQQQQTTALYLALNSDTFQVSH
jgi:uncharacterized protein (DUF1800 family)/NADPH-dependent 7-cyano-7-deazaguanine reductase QueF-like protein